MLFIQTLFAGAAFIVAAAALEINEFPRTVEAGKTYTVKYSPADDTPTTFILRQGANEDLKTVSILTTAATNGKFTWSVSKDIPNASDYALQIKQGSVVNYIGPIGLTGSDAVSSAVSSAASSSVASSTSSAASSSASASGTITSSAVTTASATVSPSTGLNSTITSATLSRTSTPRPTGTSTGGVPESTGAASSLASSPFAVLFGAVAAMVYFN